MRHRGTPIICLIWEKSETNNGCPQKSQGGKMELSNDSVIHIKNGDIEYLQFRKLLEYSDIISHCYSLGTNVNFRTSSKNYENNFHIAIL